MVMSTKWVVKTQIKILKFGSHSVYKVTLQIKNDLYKNNYWYIILHKYQHKKLMQSHDSIQQKSQSNYHMSALNAITDKAHTYTRLITTRLPQLKIQVTLICLLSQFHMSTWMKACITWLDRRDMVMERNSWVRSRQPISPATGDAGGGSDMVDVETLVPDTL